MFSKKLMEPHFTLESIWEDESLFEVRVSSSNGKFSGVADCYTNREEIFNLAKALEGYPTKIEDEVTFSTGERGDISFFSLNLKCSDGAGHIKARVKIAHIVTYTNQAPEKDIAEFEFSVEPAAIDRFVNGVKQVAKLEIGEVRAKLRGKT